VAFPQNSPPIISRRESEVEQKGQCAKAVHQIKDLAKNVRITYSRLRPELLDDLGLAAAIENQINKFNSHLKKTKIKFSANLPDKRFDYHIVKSGSWRTPLQNRKLAFY